LSLTTEMLVMAGVQECHVVSTVEDKHGRSEIFQFLDDCCNHH